MSYIDLINRYWSISIAQRLPPMCAVIYFYLLHKCNVRRWENPFNLPNRDMEIDLNISRGTIVSNRELLKNHGLIEFKNGIGKTPPQYKIIDANVSSKRRVVQINDNSPSRAVQILNNKTDDTPPQVVQILDNSPDELFNKSTTPDPELFKYWTTKSTTRQKTHINIEDNIRHIPPTTYPPRSSPSSSPPYDEGENFEYFLNEFFGENKIAAIEQQCMSLRVPIEQYRALANEVISDWIIAAVKHDSYRDAAQHLISHIRKKLQYHKKNQSNEATNANRELTAEQLRQQRAADLADYAARNIGNDDCRPGGNSGDLPF